MSITVSRVLHAGYVFTAGLSRILFDPVFETPFSGNCFAFPDVRFRADVLLRERFDAVFLSHVHDDHFSVDSLALIDRATPVFLYGGSDAGLAVLRSLGFTRVAPLTLDRPVAIGEFEIIPRLALDECVDCIFHIRSGELNILNVVDAWIDDETLASLATYAPWDLVLWPFQTMRELAVLSPRRSNPYDRAFAREGLAQLAALKPRYVVPSSCQFRLEPWSWMNQALFPVTYAEFADVAREVAPTSTVLRLNPGCAVTLDRTGLSLAPNLPWVTPVGTQDVDYAYDEDVVPAATSAIATKFRRPSDADLARARRFATTELPRRFDELSASDSPYFARARRWRLRLHAPPGPSLGFDYVASPDGLIYVGPVASDSSSSGSATPAPEWTTDIPLVKLLDAVDEGATLPSLYIRINEHALDPATERELDGLDASDLLEDPLLRALFARGGPVDYQRAQLRRRGVSC